MRTIYAALFLALILAGCANRKTTDVDFEDASQAHKVKFGTVLDSRPVSIRTEESGATAAGAMLGGGAGALLGQTNGATFAGLVIGALAGSRLHALAETNNGVEYTIALADGSTALLSQLQGSEERVFVRGDAVMVQYGSTVNRVLAAEQLPDQVARPKGVKVVGAVADKLDTKTCDKATSGRGQREACTQH